MSEIVERLRRGDVCDQSDGRRCRAMDTRSGCDCAEAADEIDRLTAREKDLTLEGLSLIGRLEGIREVLAGTDAGSLPNDYSTKNMAQVRMDEIDRLTARVEELERALEAIISLAESYLNIMPDRHGIHTPKLDAARAALTPKQGGE